MCARALAGGPGHSAATAAPPPQRHPLAHSQWYALVTAASPDFQPKYQGPPCCSAVVRPQGCPSVALLWGSCVHATGAACTASLLRRSQTGPEPRQAPGKPQWDMEATRAQCMGGDPEAQVLAGPQMWSGPVDWAVRFLVAPSMCPFLVAPSVSHLPCGPFLWQRRSPLAVGATAGWGRRRRPTCACSRPRLRGGRWRMPLRAARARACPWSSPRLSCQKGKVSPA